MVFQGGGASNHFLVDYIQGFVNEFKSHFKVVEDGIRPRRDVVQMGVVDCPLSTSCPYLIL